MGKYEFSVLSLTENTLIFLDIVEILAVKEFGEGYARTIAKALYCDNL